MCKFGKYWDIGINVLNMISIWNINIMLIFIYKKYINYYFPCYYYLCIIIIITIIYYIYIHLYTYTYII